MSFFSIPDVESEIEVYILTRAGIFSSTELNLSDLTIAPNTVHPMVLAGVEDQISVKYHSRYQNMTNEKGQRQIKDLAKMSAISVGAGMC